VSNPNTDEGLLLVGLDGSNPLAFLAALGTLRTLSLAWPERNVKMAWRQHSGAWRPFISASNPPLDETPDSENCVVDQLTSRLKCMADHPALRVPERNLKVRSAPFREYLVAATNNASPADRLFPDFAASLGTEGAVEKTGKNKGTIRRSALQMVNGGKRQDYIPVINELIDACTGDHIRNTLFQKWHYQDSMVALNLRWDPVDNRRYALRWDDPSEQKTRRTGSQLGANRLAIEAIPFFPVVAVGRDSRTAGFAPSGSVERFSWPIWIHPANADVCRSLIALEQLQEDAARIDTSRLRSLGIREVFRCQRYAVDKYQTASFTPAHAL